MHINEKLMEKREDLLLLGKSSGKEREKKEEEAEALTASLVLK